MDVHVVSKSNNSQHATFSLPTPSSQEDPPLNPSSVRVRTTLLGLTSNNLSYARGGTRLHWWDAYPVPPTSPAPYNDSSEWGIVPAWGLASVTDSSIPDLPAGTTLYGFWPTSALPVDLELRSAEAEAGAGARGHWREVSSRRSSLMPLYNRYRVFETGGKGLEEFGWDVTVGAIMMAGYVLSEYVFTPDPVNHPPVHPLTESEEWTVEDADLSKTVFVSLAASTKTARTVAYNFFCRPRNTGPLAFLQVTSKPKDILEAAEKFIPQFPVGAIAYEDVASSGGWIARLRPERVVVADFGARDGALDDLVKSIEGTPELQSMKVTVLAVGNQQKVYTPEELQASRESFVSLNKLQMNTSPIQETAARHRGLGLYHEELQKRWDHWLKNRECAAPDLSLVWGKGIGGTDGIEGGWEALCQSKVRPSEALVYRV